MEEMASLDRDVTFTPRPLKNENNKWLVRSAFQKAIRRGQIDYALRFGEYLYYTDENYAWYSLAVVVIEDISWGAPDLVSYTALTALKSVRQTLDPKSLFGKLVVMACLTEKSRSCCEISGGVYETMGDQQNEMFKWPTDLLEETILTGEATQSYMASIVLRKRLRGPKAVQMHKFLKKIEDAIPVPVYARAARLSFDRSPNDMNFAFYPSIYWLRQWGEPVELFDETMIWPESRIIGNVPAEAYDSHERRGKVALKAFHTRMCKKYDVFKRIPENKGAKAMGGVIFFVEGAMIDKRLTNSKLKEWTRFQDWAYATVGGCPEEDWEEIAQLCRENIEELHQCREWVVGKEGGG